MLVFFWFDMVRQEDPESYCKRERHKGEGVNHPQKATCLVKNPLKPIIKTTRKQQNHRKNSLIQGLASIDKVPYAQLLFAPGQQDLGFAFLVIFYFWPY